MNKELYDAAEPATEKAVTKNKKILSLIENSKLRYCKSNGRVPPIVTIAGKPLLYPQTLNTIQGKKGVVKSMLAAHICATILQKDGIENILGLQKNFGDMMGEGVVVVYIDTERGLNHQFPEALKDITQLSGYDRQTVLDKFIHLSLKLENREKRLSLVESLFKYIEETFPRHHYFVVVDVATDITEDFNNLNSSNVFIDKLNMLVENADYTAVCIIHENPGNETKMRGHLGTELGNKGTTNIALRKIEQGNSRYFEFYTDKLREAADIKNIYFKVVQDGNFRHLALATTLEIEDIEKNKVAHLPDLITQLITFLQTSKRTAKDTINYLCGILRTSEKTIRERLKTIEDNPHLIKDNGYVLHWEKIKREKNKKYYWLEEDIAKQGENHELFEEEVLGNESLPI